jgi:mono/diheme cytochrome c family protein
MGSIVVAGLVATQACGGLSPSGATCPTDSTLTYDTFGKDFFNTNCLRCHSSTTKGQTPLFDTQDLIKASKTKIDEEAASGPKSTNDTMPNDKNIATSERAKLGEWLACGAP